MPVEILVTGFEPFADYVTNPSWEAVRLCRARWPANIASAELPVDRVRAHDRLRALLSELEPRAVLCTGVARGSVFRIEKLARRPIELAHVAGDERLDGHWPWAEMHGELEQLGLPILHSEDAGQYVCESTYWSLLSHRAQAENPQFAAFLHVPHESDVHTIERIAAAIDRIVDARSKGLPALR